MKKCFFLFSGFVLISVLSYSQSVGKEVNASAGEFFNVGRTGLSWTLGEVSVESYGAARGGSLSQGFHQAPSNRGFLYHFIAGFIDETIATESEISQTKIVVNDAGEGEELSFTIFPNPAADFINIQLDGSWEDDVIINIMDMLGRIVLIENLNDIRTSQLNISSLQSGFYILQLQSKKLNTIHSTKINKIN